MNDPRATCRANVIAYLRAHPGCSSSALYEAVKGGYVSDKMIASVIRELKVSRVMELQGTRNVLVGDPVDNGEADAEAHFRAHGALGATIVRLAREQGVSLRYLLSGRAQWVGRVRGVIIANLSGSVEEIAAAFRLKPETVAFYRVSRPEAA